MTSAAVAASISFQISMPAPIRDEQEPALLPQGLAVAAEDFEGHRADADHAAVHEAAARLGSSHQDLGLRRRRPGHHGEHGQVLGERRRPCR